MDFMVLTVKENATQLVIAVIRSREFVKMVASQDGKATFVKAVTFKLFKAYLQFFKTCKLIKVADL